MVSLVRLSKEKNPLRAIEFTGSSGKRHRLRIGRVLLKDAQEMKRQVEHLVNAVRLGQSLSDRTSDWLESLDVKTRSRLVRFGLCESPSFDSVIDDFLKRSKSTGAKPSWLKRVEDSIRLLKLHMDTSAQASKITTADAREWRRLLKGTGLSEDSVRTATRDAKRIFKACR